MSFNIRNVKELGGYFDELPKATQALVKQIMTEIFENEVPGDTYGADGSYRVDELECRSRDGFIPFSHNKGGLNVSGFTDLSGIWGSGYYPSNSKSKDRIETLVESSLQDATKAFFNKHEETLAKFKIERVSQVDYHTLSDSEHQELKDLAEELSEFENEYLQGDSSTVMYSIRIMYHGRDSRGVHSASISAALNTEAPYHRSKYDDNTKEVEITWMKSTALKTKLTKALKTVTKAVF